MVNTDRFPRGVFVPALTPFSADLAVDRGRFLAHCTWLLEQGANGVAVFGTTSEANSLSNSERMQLLDHLIDHDVRADVLMPGTGCCALPDTVALTRHAMEHGAFGVLLLPPFYYKNVSDDGVFASIAEVVQRVADSRLRIYLYHIPPMAGVGFSLPVIERLLKAFPGVVVGIKDSSGDWKNTEALLKTFPDFEVFPGSETYLLDALRMGGAGCISATANVNVATTRQLIDGWTSPTADARQAQLTAVRAAIQKYPLVSANKAILAQAWADPGWNAVRPPLCSLSTEATIAMLRTLEALQFSLPSKLQQPLATA